MTDDKAALEPCPFCGRTDVAQGASSDDISVWCFCGARGPSVPFPENCDPLPPILECHAKWNTRALLPAQRGEGGVDDKGVYRLKPGQAGKIIAAGELPIELKRLREVAVQCRLNAKAENVKTLEGRMDRKTWQDIGSLLDRAAALIAALPRSTEGWQMLRDDECEKRDAAIADVFVPGRTVTECLMRLAALGYEVRPIPVKEPK